MSFFPRQQGQKNNLTFKLPSLTVMLSIFLIPVAPSPLRGDTGTMEENFLEA